MFIQSFKGNIFFVILVNIILLSLMLLGELWFHKKLLILFPRYFSQNHQLKEQDVGKKYQLTNNEEYVVQKLGRQIVIIVALTYLIVSTFLVYLHFLNKQTYYGILSLICLVFIYHMFRKIKK